ncbi:MAG TPA: tyrosinase family protein [Candidatus Dormibacteraeota bacterium]|jgi:tyrosinase|nr:tyrosinase family protein [Candidatus Dormibacteraeota bacterium]
MAATPLSLRLDVDHADIASLRDAYGKMQAISGTDNRSWIYWAGYHGFSNFYCWHHASTGADSTEYPYSLFLPWHRAYLMYWDQAARDQNPGAALSWWDWSAQTGVPDAFAQEQVDGAGNPLFDGPMPDMSDQPARRTRRWPGDPSQLPSASDVDSMMALSSFEDFQAQIEQLHDAVHGWAGGINPDNEREGGDMASIPVAAYDPLFWAHHCMIDRLWYLWQLRYGVSNIPPNYLQLTLAPFRYKVSDVLDIHALGYEYAAAATTVAGTTQQT